MSFNDLDPDIRDLIRRKLDVTNDLEYAAGVLLDRVDENSKYDKPAGSVFEEIFDNTALRFNVQAADVFVVEE